MEKRIFKPHISTQLFAMAISGFMLFLLIYGIYVVNSIYYLILASLLGLFLVFLIYKSVLQITTDKFSLIISSEGIYNGTDLFGKIFIPWKDIERICTNTSAQTAAIYTIVIHLKNSEKIIEAQKGWLNKSTLKSRYSKYGSPIIISHTSLDSHTNIYDLEKALNEGYRLFQ